MQDCMHIARMAREREAMMRSQGSLQGSIQEGYVFEEISKLVLGV